MSSRSNRTKPATAANNQQHLSAKEMIKRSAAAIVHSILSMFHGGADVKGNVDAIIDKAFKIADVAHGKIDPEIASEAHVFLHGLLANQHVLNLTDAEIDQLVQQAILLAQKFHKKE